MSYTSPLGNLADLKFGTGYTAPLGNAADLAFPETVFLATGFCSTQFGTPSATQPPTAAGFCSTQVGTPSAGVRVSAVGSSTTQLGSPTGHLVHPATSLGRGTRFGTPSSPVTQTGVAEGFCTTRFSHYTYGIVMSGPGPGYYRPAGFRNTQFGTPVSSENRMVAASSLSPSAKFGTPKVATAASAQSVTPSTVFGLPATSLTTTAHGFTGTAFGTPATRVAVKATSLYRPTRFGTPTASRPDVHVVRPWAPVTRCGHPRRYVAPQYDERWHFATSLSSTNFGTPTTNLRYRAAMTPPVTRFGTPLLTRNPQC